MSLTINNSSTGTSSVTSCDDFLWNGVVYTTSGSYDETFTNASGCDSVHTLALIIQYSDLEDNYISICFNEEYSIGNSTYSQTGVYYDTIISVSGCDHIIVTHLTVIEEIQVTVVQNGQILNTQIIGGVGPYIYRWNTFETTSSITPSSDGQYWVIVTDDEGCNSDTAYYYVGINPLDINEFNFSDLVVYPNPARDFVNISFDVSIKSSFELSLVNVLGETLIKEKIINQQGDYKYTFKTSNFNKGIYFVEILTEKGKITKRVIVQ